MLKIFNVERNSLGVLICNCFRNILLMRGGYVGGGGGQRAGGVAMAHLPNDRAEHAMINHTTARST